MLGLGRPVEKVSQSINEDVCHPVLLLQATVVLDREDEGVGRSAQEFASTVTRNEGLTSQRHSPCRPRQPC